MCRNIKTLFNFEPPATDDELFLSAQQFVRKLSGFSQPSKANEAIFEETVREVAQISRRLVDNLATDALPKNREAEAAKVRARSAARFSARAPER